MGETGKNSTIFNMYINHYIQMVGTYISFPNADLKI